MKTSTLRHRHLVATPLVIAVLAMGFLDAQTRSPVRASVQSTVAEDLQEGSTIVSSEGIVRIQSDGVSFMTMDGAMHLTKGSQSTVVAALSAPVVVMAGDLRMVVPIGMQWELTEDIATLNDGFAVWMDSRTPQVLPLSFLERTMNDLDSLQPVSGVLPQVRHHLPLNVLPDEQLLLPVSYNRNLALIQEHTLGVLRHAVEMLDVDRIEELLAHDLMLDALATPRGVEVVTMLLSDTDSEHTAVRMLLMQQLIADEDVWLASSFHPAYRDIAWALSAPEVSTESRLSRLFVLPHSFMSADSYSDFVVERYSGALQSTADTVGDSNVFIADVVTAHQPLIDQLTQRGYPKRALHLRQILLDLLAEASDASEQLQEAKALLHRQGHVDISPLPLAPKEDVSTDPITPEPVEIFAPQLVEAKAYTMLEHAGALFTIHSTVTSIEGTNTARVLDIIFSAPTTDRATSFTLDVVTKDVTDIEINGDTNFPYSPTFDGFVRWVRT